MAVHHLRTPLTDADIETLRSGDVAFVTGTVHTGRDAAHKRLIDALDRGEAPPFELAGALIYYVGPSPAPPGRPIGAAGPTTSYRMDTYAPRLHALGLKGTIGKGRRSQEVKDAMVACKAVYFGATGGAGALLSQRIKAARIIAYEDLGPEAIRQLTVEDFPLLVINDCHGGELYATPDLEAALGKP
ncbi:Fe-S-containing hydro-lyase [Fundidesulfovibrio butyratiphilus]